MYLLPAGSGICVVKRLRALTFGEDFRLNFSYGEDVRCCFPPDVVLLFVKKVPVILPLCGLVIDLTGEKLFLVVKRSGLSF
jgi:hypothetical protein